MKHPPISTCRWTEDEDAVWNTDCGRRWEFTNGTPRDNKVTFCAFCGRKLTQRRFRED